MSDKKVILIGYSGHGFVIADTAIENGFRLIGYSDKLLNLSNPYNLEYLGYESEVNYKGWDLNADFIIGIGDNKVRDRIYKLITYNKRKVISVIHSSSSISKYSHIGDGIFINRNVSINAFAKIGNNVILNTGCVIEHECIIEDNVHVAPGAVLAGNVKIGSNSFIGANAIIKQGVFIGENVTIGAGSVVLADIPDNKKVVGNPHRYI